MDNTNNPLIRSPKRNFQLNKDMINKIRHGSPRLKEVLRQKYRQRIQQKRNEVVNNRRFGLNETDDSGMELFQENADLLQSMNEHFMSNILNDSQEELLNIEQEFLDEQEQLAIDEYDYIQEFEKFMDEFNAFSSDINQTNDVLCPMCQKSTMFEGPGSIICSGCQFTLPLKMSMENFHDAIHLKTAVHSANCNCSPAFITVPEFETISLYLTCEACSCCLLIM